MERAPIETLSWTWVERALITYLQLNRSIPEAPWRGWLAAIADPRTHNIIIEVARGRTGATNHQWLHSTLTTIRSGRRISLLSESKVAIRFAKMSEAIGMRVRVYHPDDLSEAMAYAESPPQELQTISAYLEERRAEDRSYWITIDGPRP